jgi:hypothetical protein
MHISRSAIGLGSSAAEDLWMGYFRRRGCRAVNLLPPFDTLSRPEPVIGRRFAPTRWPGRKQLRVSM